MHFCMHSQSGYRFHDHTSDRLGKGIKMTRKANGQGHTYKVGNSYRTAIRRGDHVVTATGPTAQESRKRAKAKLESLPNLGGKSLTCGNTGRTRSWIIVAGSVTERIALVIIAS